MDGPFAVERFCDFINRVGGNVSIKPNDERVFVADILESVAEQNQFSRAYDEAVVKVFCWMPLELDFGMLLDKFGQCP